MKHISISCNLIYFDQNSISPPLSKERKKVLKQIIQMKPISIAVLISVSLLLICEIQNEMIRFLILVSLLLLFAISLTSVKSQIEIGRKFLLNLMQEFTNQYTGISIEGLDYLGMSQIWDLFGTKIRFSNITGLNVDQDVNREVLKIYATSTKIDLVVAENKLMIPIKMQDLSVSIFIKAGQNQLNCTQVQIDCSSFYLEDNILRQYQDVNFLKKYLDKNLITALIDPNKIVEYLAQQFLNSGMIKSVIKNSEIPIRNLINNALKNYYQVLQEFLKQLQNDELNPKVLIAGLKNVPIARVENKEYIINIKKIQTTKSFNFF
ncbi:unnamed protein product (macronuclear) [Paramecium tetraurelia]|uniref:Transmembrane protein n=1 Tax=Paramecium tetraurelia TaxID=5888 RepID=A0DXU4_PARTE|nr:uncharacterized protein GSPATT00021485001 [Paramecium tetraurelia]CAK87861.1 unnamed protein product [Paramecium tetraurelia]|eukprot:XP_001455258.1 hypothetical protein (macronuclear) [Paramecium tetraurelia strain d4-2]